VKGKENKESKVGMWGWVKKGPVSSNKDAEERGAERTDERVRSQQHVNLCSQSGMKGKRVDQ